MNMSSTTRKRTLLHLNVPFLPQNWTYTHSILQRMTRKNRVVWPLSNLTITLTPWCPCSLEINTTRATQMTTTAPNNGTLETRFSLSPIPLENGKIEKYEHTVVDWRHIKRRAHWWLVQSRCSEVIQDDRVVFYKKWWIRYFHFGRGRRLAPLKFKWGESDQADNGHSWKSNFWCFPNISVSHSLYFSMALFFMLPSYVRFIPSLLNSLSFRVIVPSLLRLIVSMVGVYLTGAQTQRIQQSDS